MRRMILLMQFVMNGLAVVKAFRGGQAQDMLSVQIVVVFWEREIFCVLRYLLVPLRVVGVFQVMEAVSMATVRSRPWALPSTRIRSVVLAAAGAGLTTAVLWSLRA